MSDLQTLWTLRWRQYRDDAIYWLRAAGYQPHDPAFSQKVYIFYLLIIAAIWCAAMFGWVFEQAGHIGRALSSADIEAVRQFVPRAILALQIFTLIVALRSTPLKLSFPDMAYIAGSPIDRAAPVLLGFARQVIVRLGLLLPLAALVSAVLRHALRLDASLTGLLPAVLAAIPLIILIWGIAWVIGLLRLIDPRIRRLRWLWIAPLGVLPLSIILPFPLLTLGAGFAEALTGDIPLWYALLTTALAGACIILLKRLGARASMIHAADESILHARLQALGLLAWTQPRAHAQIRLQAAQAGRRPFGRLPRVRGFTMLLARAALSYARHPLMLLWCFAWGGLMSALAAAILLNRLPFPHYLLWLLLASLTVPHGLLHVFAADVEEPFLRQFIPIGGLTLFFADTLLPLTALSLGASIVWALQAGVSPQVIALGISSIPLIALLIALSGAFALTRRRVLQTRVFATFGSLGAALIAGTATESPFTGIVAAVFAAFILSVMIAVDA